MKIIAVFHNDHDRNARVCQIYHQRQQIPHMDLKRINKSINFLFIDIHKMQMVCTGHFKIISQIEKKIYLII